MLRETVLFCRTNETGWSFPTTLAVLNWSAIVNQPFFFGLTGASQTDFQSVKHHSLARSLANNYKQSPGLISRSKNTIAAPPLLLLFFFFPLPPPSTYQSISQPQSGAPWVQLASRRILPTAASETVNPSASEADLDSIGDPLDLKNHQRYWKFSNVHRALHEDVETSEKDHISFIRAPFSRKSIVVLFHFL